MKYFVVGACALILPCSFSWATASFVNFETPPTHPLDITPDGTRLLAVNTADNRLELFSLTGAMPLWIGSIPVGLGPVSVRARSNTEAWVVNNISDTVSVVSLTTMNVFATLAVGDEPADVVFAGAPQRAFVSIGGLNHVKIYNPTSLASAPIILPVAMYDPRAMATDGLRVYVASFNSGNFSTILNETVVSSSGPYGGQNPPPNSGATFSPPLNPANPPAPAVGLIVNRETGHMRDDNNAIWDAQVPWVLLNNDVAMINAATSAVTYVTNIANINTSMAIQPGTNAPTITGEYLVNESRFENKARDGLSHVRIITFDPLNPPPLFSALNKVSDLNQHLFANPPIPIYKQTVTQAEHDLSIGLVRGVAWNAAGTSAYVAGMGSNNVVRTNNTGTRLATINVGQGPSGLAFDGPRNRLYVLNRFDATLSIINAATDAEILPRVPFFDPTPAVIKNGRPLFYDTHLTSMRGQVACASCHVDGRNDMQPWDAGDPAGSMVSFSETCNAGLPLIGACNDWHPMKGPLLTQTLFDLNAADPFHWRGDRHNLAAFSGGFPGFLASSPPSPAQMDLLDNFLLSLTSGPQPNRTITDGLPPTVSGYPGSPASGAALFAGPPIGGGAVRCTDCHSLPTGGGNTLISANLLNESQALKVPQLRDLYRRTGFSKSSLQDTRGFGYSHDGSFESIFEFLPGHFATFAAGAAGDAQRRDLEAFLVCFPTATHPAVGVQLTFDGANNNSPAALSLYATMLSLADSGAVGLVAKGRQLGIARGYAYLPGTDTFQSDRTIEAPHSSALRQSAAAGSEITFTVVPAGTQTRTGIDRDEDGYFDRDELDLCANPADAASIPGAIGADIDANGVVDSSDITDFVAVLTGHPINPAHIPRCDMNCDQHEDGRDVQGFVQSLFGP
ncbi:MAG: hypothetical protein U1A27_05400 [Phycisphaerae bacterium]